jgi:hypothetical protein
MLEHVIGVVASWGRPCLVAKSSWGSIWMGWLAPCSDLWPTTILMKGQGFLPSVVLSHGARVGGGSSLGDMQPCLGCLWRCLTTWIPMS